MSSSTTPIVLKRKISSSDVPNEETNHNIEVRKIVIIEHKGKDKKIEDVWKSAIGVEDLSSLESHIRLDVKFTSRGSDELTIPQELADRIVTIQCTSNDGRTIHIDGVSCLRNVTTLTLGDALVLPRYNDVDIPTEFENPQSAFIMNKHKDIQSAIGDVVFISSFANRFNSKEGEGDKMLEILETKDESNPKAQRLIPYEDIGRMMYPNLANLEMHVYQHYGLHAAIQSLGTMSHIDGTLAIWIHDIGSWLEDCVPIMHQFLRFPNVRVLKIRYWYNCRGASAFGSSPVPEGNVALIWKDITFILDGLFGHYTQEWKSLEQIDFDVTSELSNTKVPLKPLLKFYFPRKEWLRVIDRSPKLNSIGIWESRNSIVTELEPFFYSLELRYPSDESRRPHDEQIKRILSNSTKYCTIDQKIMRSLISKCEKCECCKFFPFKRFRDYSKTWKEWVAEEKADLEATRIDSMVV